MRIDLDGVAKDEEAGHTACCEVVDDRLDDGGALGVADEDTALGVRDAVGKRLDRKPTVVGFSIAEKQRRRIPYALTSTATAPSMSVRWMSSEKRYGCSALRTTGPEGVHILDTIPRNYGDAVSLKMVSVKKHEKMILLTFRYAIRALERSRQTNSLDMGVFIRDALILEDDVGPLAVPAHRV